MDIYITIVVRQNFYSHGGERVKVLIVSGIILILLVIGFMNLFLRAYKKAKDRNFANEYLNKYRILVNKFPYSFDDEVFEWIQKNSVKLQQYGVLWCASKLFAAICYLWV